jgi:hypothetical protein
VKTELKVYLRFASGLLALAAACSDSKSASNQPNAVAFVPQDSLCNKADPQLTADRGLDTGAVSFARANGYYGWCLPEYDDDQRLSDGTAENKEYGPIAHVLAAPWLDTLNFTQDFRQVAIVEVDSVSDPLPAPYGALRLGQFNCLYLKLLTPGASDQFRALMIPPSAKLECPVAPIDSGQTLFVAVDASGSNNASDYPPTTRFIEAQNHQTMIGVKCGPHWCMVGPSEKTVAQPSAHHNIALLTGNARGRVKGWFDDQMLGIPDLVSKHKIHRQIRASAIPDTALAHLHVSDFIVSKGTEAYRTVGWVYFPAPPDPQSKYVKVFGFTQGINRVGMRAEDQSSTPGQPDIHWFTQVRNAKDQITNDIKTVRMDHSKFFKSVYGDQATVPGTMRWRWFDKDEDLWVGCDIGCCLAGKS